MTELAFSWLVGGVTSILRSALPLVIFCQKSKYGTDGGCQSIKQPNETGHAYVHSNIQLMMFVYFRLVIFSMQLIFIIFLSKEQIWMRSCWSINQPNETGLALWRGCILFLTRIPFLLDKCIHEENSSKKKQIEILAEISDSHTFPGR